MKIDSPVLVTGAGGFIGSHLTEALLGLGCDVRAMVHYNSRNDWGWLEEAAVGFRTGRLWKTALGVRYPASVGGGSLEIVPGDVRDPFFVKAAVKGCATVFHLAALIGIPYSYVSPASYVSTNVQGTLNILQACLDSSVSRLVHTSTSEVYGSARYTPMDEYHPLAGQSPYSASKIGADHLAESFHRSFGLPVCIVRPFNTFGPRQSARAVIPTVIAQALTGAEVIKLGSLSPVRDLNYVADTVAGFVTAAGCGGTVGRAVNIGRGKGMSIGELARLVLDLCGSTAKIVTDPERVRPEESEVVQLVCDNSRAFKTMGWKPRFSIEEGIAATVEWMRARLSRFKPGVYNV